MAAGLKADSCSTMCGYCKAYRTQPSASWRADVHELLVDNRVIAVFHGHDHFYGYQSMDGIVHQEVPQPAWPGTTLPDPTGDGDAGGIFMASSGDLRVRVSPSRATIDYARALLPSAETSTPWLHGLMVRLRRVLKLERIAFRPRRGPDHSHRR